MPPASSDLPPPSRRHDWLPSRRGLLLAALAFVAGLVLFAVVWRTQSRNDFYTVEPVAGPSAARAFDPLPTPLPANRDRGASGMGEREREADDADARSADVETRRPPEPVATLEPPPAPLPPPPVPVAATQPPQPIPGQTPPPNYPRRALRRGIEGTVMVRVDVGPDGVPTSVGISRSSSSRELDRAAIEAVERWRFRPAMADGRPTVGTVVVPIDFNAQR